MGPLRTLPPLAHAPNGVYSDSSHRPRKRTVENFELFCWSRRHEPRASERPGPIALVGGCRILVRLCCERWLSSPLVDCGRPQYEPRCAAATPADWLTASRPFCSSERSRSRTEATSRSPGAGVGWPSSCSRQLRSCSGSAVEVGALDRVFLGALAALTIWIFASLLWTSSVPGNRARGRADARLSRRRHRGIPAATPQLCPRRFSSVSGRRPRWSSAYAPRDSALSGESRRRSTRSRATASLIRSATGTRSESSQRWARCSPSASLRGADR